MTVKNIFGRWKGRFARFLKGVDMCVTSVVPMTNASCILHNLCKMQNANFLTEWEEKNVPVEEPICRTHMYNDILATDAEDTRAALTEFLWHSNFETVNCKLCSTISISSLRCTI